MKKGYEMPLVTVLALSYEDILTASIGDTDNLFSLPNLNGWPGKL